MPTRHKFSARKPAWRSCKPHESPAACRFANAKGIATPTGNKNRDIVARNAKGAPKPRVGSIQRVGNGDGQVQQLVVRDTAPEEEREARCEIDVADPVHLTWPGAGRILLDAIEEVGRDEHPFQRGLNAGVEAALGLLAALLNGTTLLTGLAGGLLIGELAALLAPREGDDDGIAEEVVETTGLSLTPSATHG